MHKTVKAMIDPNGTVHFDEPLHFSQPQRVLIVIIDKTPSEDDSGDITLLSEPALAHDWERPEEEEAWGHLQVRSKKLVMRVRVNYLRRALN